MSRHQQRSISKTNSKIKEYDDSVPLNFLLGNRYSGYTAEKIKDAHFRSAPTLSHSLPSPKKQPIMFLDQNHEVEPSGGVGAAEVLDEFDHSMKKLSRPERESFAAKFLLEKQNTDLLQSQVIQAVGVNSGTVPEEVAMGDLAHYSPPGHRYRSTNAHSDASPRRRTRQRGDGALHHHSCGSLGRSENHGSSWLGVTSAKKEICPEPRHEVRKGEIQRLQQRHGVQGRLPTHSMVREREMLDLKRHYARSQRRHNVHIIRKAVNTTNSMQAQAGAEAIKREALEQLQKRKDDHEEELRAVRAQVQSRKATTRLRKELRDRLTGQMDAAGVAQLMRTVKVVDAQDETLSPHRIDSFLADRIYGQSTLSSISLEQGSYLFAGGAGASSSSPHRSPLSKPGSPQTQTQAQAQAQEQGSRRLVSSLRLQTLRAQHHHQHHHQPATLARPGELRAPASRQVLGAGSKPLGAGFKPRSLVPVNSAKEITPFSVSGSSLPTR